MPKSGTKTAYVGKFWSGVLGKATKGIELGTLAVVDIKNNTAFNLETIQTPNQETLKAKGQNLVEHYTTTILARSSELLDLTDYLLVDVTIVWSVFFKREIKLAYNRYRKTSNAQKVEECDEYCE